MLLVVLILPNTENSQKFFNEHALLELSVRVEGEKDFRWIG
nr:unnamed protein product [Callosobruchus analis]